MSQDHARSHAGLSLTALAGLAAAGLCWAAASAQSTTDWTKAQVVEIDLKNFAFSPSRLVLQQGQVYRLHFVNQSSGGQRRQRDVAQVMERAPLHAKMLLGISSRIPIGLLDLPLGEPALHAQLVRVAKHPSV